ncbi:MAG: hypothetical protein KIT36_01830 [Alphaproteobacteria bacterium]|nr:hypothetical protein [Alphaproteobacteria bacterium]
MRRILLPLILLGVVGCVPDSGYYDGPPPRGGYYGSPSGYYPPPSRSYDSAGQCTFQTRRGPVPGYVPAGKDRCCIETRYGPSCQ